MGDTEQKHKVLVVDDEVDVTEMLAINLAERGYEVETLSKPRDTAEVALRFNPDVILLDYVMPKMSGAEVLNNLRRIPRFIKTPIVFVSAVASPDGETENSTEAGGGPLQKPVALDDLVKRIEAELEAAAEGSSES